MPTDEQRPVRIRLVGDDAACREVLERIGRVLRLDNTRGPRRRRDGDGFTWYTEGTVPRVAADPGTPDGGDL
jgi:hypothetical protein